MGKKDVCTDIPPDILRQLLSDSPSKYLKLRCVFDPNWFHWLLELAGVIVLNDKRRMGLVSFFSPPFCGWNDRPSRFPDARCCFGFKIPDEAKLQLCRVCSLFPSPPPSFFGFMIFLHLPLSSAKDRQFSHQLFAKRQTPSLAFSRALLPYYFFVRQALLPPIKY